MKNNTQLQKKTQDSKAMERRLRRSAARLAAVQALYQMDMTGRSVQNILHEFETHHVGLEVDGMVFREFEPTLFNALVRGVVERQQEIDPAIHDALKQGWPLARIDSILRAIFRVASYELMALNKTPPIVIINEYIDIAKAFFEGKESKFVNAVLDSLARRFQPERM